MGKTIIGVLLVIIFSTIAFILIDYENPNAKMKENQEMANQYEFIQDVSEELEEKGYRTTGTILSQEYAETIKFTVPISEEEYKSKKLENAIKDTFNEVAKLYEIKPFTVIIQNKDTCCS